MLFNRPTPRTIVLFLLMVTLAMSSVSRIWGAAAENKAASATQSEILQLLHKQVEDWNHGNIEGFMAGYWNSPDLTFYSGATVTRGWQPTLERYKKRYQGAGQEMGTLNFDDLDVTVVSGDTAMVRGRWRLEMKEGKKPQGVFTLLLRKFPEGWRIVHDHSSGQA